MKHWIIACALPVLVTASGLMAFAQTDDAVDTAPGTITNPDGKGGGSINGTTAKNFDPKNFPQGPAFPFTLLDYALYKHVTKDGNVDYAALKGNLALDLFVKAVGAADRSQFPTFKAPPADDKSGDKSDDKSKDKQPVATVDTSFESVFLVNAYNAFVLKTISDAYPVNSIDDIKNFDTAKTHLLAGKMVSLAELREEILKRDPRAFFALNSGLRGGTLMAPQAYRSYMWNDLLEASAKAFINDPRNVQNPNRIQNEVYINEYFTNADKLFKPKASRRQWDGIRTLLTAYTKQSGNRNYFGGGDYVFKFVKPDRALNNKVMENTVAASG